MRIINRKPSRITAVLLGTVPFVATLLVYAVASDMRRNANPDDKLLPSIPQMWHAFARLAFEPDRRSGEYLLWVDTFDSLSRLGEGMALSVTAALVVGVGIGFVPHARAALSPFVTSFSLIPPITVLPILFIIFGLGEFSKVMLIFVGTAPIMIRSVAQSVIDIPRELVIKAETLGASVWQMTLRLVLPQILPRLITAVRLGLVPAWIFLISAEAIASTSGLGYRIFLVRRYLAMDVILPYVIWITLLAFVIDRLLLLASRAAFRWHHLDNEAI